MRTIYVLAIWMAASACSAATPASGANASGVKNHCYAVTAYVMAGRFVRTKLTHPETARFPAYKEPGADIRELGDCRYEINSHVTTKDEYGEEFTYRFSATMTGELNGSVWRTGNLLIEK